MRKSWKQYLVLLIMAVGFTWFGIHFEGCRSEIVIGNPPPWPTEEAVEHTLAEADDLPLQNHEGQYYYEQLNNTEQIWYAQMHAILANMEEEKSLSAVGNDTVGEEGIDKIFNCIMNDYPELFYVESYKYTVYSYGEEIDRIEFTGVYTMAEGEKETRQKMIDAVVAECLSGIDATATEYEKVKYVYEYVINATDFKEASMDNQTILSVFLGKQSVCMGYAKAVQYLLNRMGIQTTLVLGHVADGPHAWNLVRVDGEYYYLDATWGDASYYNPDDKEYGKRLANLNYDYLCVTSDEMAKTHTIESEVSMPECTAMAANYYVIEGRYFVEYDEKGLESIFEKAYAEGQKTLSFKCANQTVYDTFVDKLITDNGVFKFLQGIDDRYTYVIDPNMLSVTFWLVNE